MSGTWRVDVAAVRHVLDRTAAAAPHGDAYPDALRSITAALLGAPGVQEAVQGFAAHRQDLPARLGQRVSAVIGAAATATEAFVAGDEEIASTSSSAQLRDPHVVLTQRGAETRP